jgi:hypothetical protein
MCSSLEKRNPQHARIAKKKDGEETDYEESRRAGEDWASPSPAFLVSSAFPLFAFSAVNSLGILASGRG